jgi:MFS family permease
MPALTMPALTMPVVAMLAGQTGPVRPMSDDPAIVRRTQLIDLLRAVPMGVLLPLETSILLTIAIKQFDASALAKGVIAAAAGVGLLLSPVVTAAARRSGRPVMHIAATIAAIGAAGYVLGVLGALPLFVAGAVVGVAAPNAVFPLLTLTYERNFPAAERGRRVGWGMSLRVGVAAVVGLVVGALLRNRLDLWWTVLLAGAVASALLAALQTATPSQPLDQVPGQRNRPWPHFHLVVTDRQLRLTLGAWMLMGFGNLMLLPLRVEYLANPKYGITADASLIALLTITVPSVCRLLSLPLFGIVFDRLSFFASRIAVNLLFALYVAAFFTGTSTAGLLVGAVVLGIASAGGDLMWSLWVIKFAPPDRVADYMGLHTFFTGVRAVLAPLIAFVVVEHVSLTAVAIAAAAMMVLSALVLVPEARAERSLRAADRP